MNFARLLCVISLAVLGAAALPSCVYYDYPYGGGYYDGGYAYDYGYGPGYYPAYGSYAYSYGGHYYRVCPICHHHPCSCGHGHIVYGGHHDGGDHHDGGGHHDGEKIKLVRSNDHRQDPEGYHSPEWFKAHGYSLKQNTYRDRSGELHGRQPAHHDDGDHSHSHKDDDKDDHHGKKH